MTDATIPITVWLTPADADHHRVVIPLSLLRQLITAYTHAGQAVLTREPDPNTSRTITGLNRRHISPRSRDAAPVDMVILTAPLAVHADHFARWSSLLHPGGVIAVVVPNHPGSSTTLAGHVVTQATNAGLEYLQHLIAIATPLRHDSDRRQGADLNAISGTVREAPLRASAHLDVLIFRRTLPCELPAAA